MPACIKQNLRGAFITLFACITFPAMATHLVGDDFTYVFVDSSGGLYHYRITFSIYEDCMHGGPVAITEDNPAYIAVYAGSSTTPIRTDSVMYTSVVPVPVVSIGPCGTTGTALCLLKKTFVKDYYLPAGSAGYTITYQRCCKNGALTNVVSPLDQGSTYYCNIPPAATAHYNNSAVFTGYPPQVLGIHNAFLFDHSATDVDGDSLSYELCAASDGAGASDVKPWPPAPPPYSDVSYSGTFTYSNPMSCSVPLSIDPVTGILSGTPNVLGRYLIAVCCHEWRGGVMINTVKREFEFDVQTLTPGSFHPFAGNDTIIYVGDDVHFDASTGASYLWTPGTYLSSTTIHDPVGHFPDAGVFPYILRETSDSGCIGYDTVIVTVLLESMYRVPTGFTPNNDGRNDVLRPVMVKNSKLLNFKVYNRKGDLLYTGTTPGDGWDGTYKGVKQEVGTYFWEVMYENDHGKLRSSVGSATLVR